MKKIEILTSNNVSIQYELATLAQRILAFLLDSIVLVVSYFICALIIAITTLNSNFLSELSIWILIIPVYLFYNIFYEVYFDGQTIGKKALNIKVKKVERSNHILLIKNTIDRVNKHLNDANKQLAKDYIVLTR
ncbi:MAG: RDD family protein [Flavobacteriales bacterium]